MEERRPLLLRHRSATGTGGQTSRPRWKTQTACGFILLTLVFERIAFYGIVANLILFLGEKPLNWSSSNAAQATMVFTGLCYTTSLFGGWLADSFLGRFKTICLFFVVYIAGYVFMTVITYSHISNPNQPPAWCGNTNTSSGNQAQTIVHHLDENISASERQIWIDKYTELSNTLNPATESCSWAIYLALTVIAIGAGSVKANMAPFGADQVKHEGPHMMRVFFNWFYWCINLGVFIAIGALAYIQQEIGFFYGIIAPNAGLLLALLILASGFVVYIMKPPGGSVLTNIVNIMKESCQVRRRRRIASTITRSMDLSDFHTPPSCLDHAKIRYGGSFHDTMVDDVKILGKVICVFLAFIPYWVVYFQMESTYVVQGLHMRLDFGGDKDRVSDNKLFKFPAAWLSLFDVIFLIILIPVMDRLIYPRLDRAGYRLSLRVRIIIGMIFSVFSVMLAGGLEMHRLSVFWQNNTANPYNQTVGGTVYSAANVNVLWQIPQYALIGISEVFASVAGLELAYTHAPRSMQGIIMGLFWFTTGVGSLVGMATISWFQGVFFFKGSNDINCRVPVYDATHAGDIYKACHLDYYFFFLAGLQVLGLVIFIVLAYKLDVGSPTSGLKNRLDISSTGSNESPIPSPEGVHPPQLSPPSGRHVQNYRSTGNGSPPSDL